MQNWSIKSKNGVTKYTVKAVEYHDTWMGEEFVTVTIKTHAPLDLAIGDYLVYRGLTYTIYNVPSALKIARQNTYGDGFSYEDVKFSALSTELSEMRFFDIVLNDNELHYTSLPTFSFYCEDVDDLLDRLQANTDRNSSSQWYFISPSYLRTVQRYEEGTAARTEAIALWTQYFGDDTSRDPAYSITDVNIDIDDKTVWDGLSQVKESFGLNFINRDRACIIGGEGVAAEHIFKYGKGNGLSEIGRTADSEQLVVTKLYSYGSDTNLPLRYYATEDSGLPNNMAVNVLMLPGFPTYSLSQLCRCSYDSVNDKTTFEVRKDTSSEYNVFMEIEGNHVVDFSTDALSPYLISANYAALGVKEGVASFTEDNDDNGLKAIYPSIEGMTVGDIEGSSSTERIDEILSCDIIQDNGVFDEGSTVGSFHLILKNLGFDLKAAYDKTGSMNLSMKDGYCGGREFTVKNVEPYNDGTWRLTVERSEDGNLDLFFPYSSAAASGGTPIADEPYQIRTGDHFILTGIEIDDTSYIWAASMKMLRKSILYLIANDYTRYSYTPKVDEIYMARQNDYAIANNIASLHDTLKSGMLMLFKDTDFNISGSIFIDSLVIKEDPSEKSIPTYEVVLREDKQVGTFQRMQNQIDSISSFISGSGGMSVETVRSLIRTVGGTLFLSKTLADAAQGVITFVKGLLFGNGETGITQNGDATLNSVQTKGYSGTDIISDKGFKVWEDSEGKSHLITDYFSARVKAFFASLEIRKIEHSAGNRIESPAGNTLALVKKYGIDSQGDPYEIVDKWYARRYGFGLSWGFKLVYSVGQYFGFWQQDPSATVAFYRCYWTADDKEAKKAVENNWKVGDQAYCQTFNLRVPQDSGFASNKYYWRLVVGTGYETIEGVEYAYIDLSNEETLYLEASKIDTPIDAQVVSGLIACSGYDSGSDAPEAGDDVACLGNQVSWTTRGGAIQYITYDPNPSTSGVIVPCVKAYAGINNFTTLDDFCFKKESPSGVFVRSNKFQIISASGTGDSSPIYCQRGAYSATETYGKNDIVQYHGASWLYINDTPSSGHAPAEGEYWTAFAQRGMGTPQVELDSVNAVVSANYEGKITNISFVSGLPTTIEVYVDGNQIPVSAWSLPNSYVKYYNNTIPLSSSSFSVAPGIGLNSITAGPNAVTLSWRYRQKIGIGGNVDPVINPTDIVVHVQFTYNGETYTADVSAPMIVQKAAASVIAQYSADGTNWEDVFNESHGHIYVRYSYDGGATWTSKIRIVGKSIEFEAAIRHYEEWDDLNDFITDNVDPPIGYYLCDEDDNNSHAATLWYYNGTQLSSVSYQDELNYIAMDADTGEAGHLWNSDGTLDHWADLGVIQGADGIDGISVTLDPATVIFEQDETSTSTFTPSPSSFTATVNVWQGATRLAANSYKVALVSTTHCSATVSGNQITSLTLGQDSNNAYYSSGDVTLGVWLDPTSTSQTPDVTLKFNWAANLLGAWKLSVESGVMTSVLSQQVPMYDDNGNLQLVPLSTIIGQTSQHVFISAQGLAGITGVDVTDGTIELRGNKVTFTNSAGTVSGKISIDPTTGTLHATDGDFDGIVSAKNYLTRYADLITYRYDAGGNDYDFVPSEDTVMNDGNGHTLDISTYWCFMVGAKRIRLPLNNSNLIGQRIVLYNPYLNIGSGTEYTVIQAAVYNNAWIYDDIRGVGLPVSASKYEPVPLNSYRQVKEIEFCNGLVELQCVPSNDLNHQCEWSVVNIGTNVVELHENPEYTN